MRVVTRAVVIQDGKVLMVQEAKEKARGQWNLPAGHLDDNEYILDAVVRETKEETGYDVRPVSLIQIFSTNDGRPQFMEFECEVVGGEIKFDPEEIMDVKWVSVEEVFNYELRPPLAEAMKVDLERIERNKTFSLDVIKELR